MKIARVSADSDFLFVYGTLRRAFKHPQHKIISINADFFSAAYMPGDLYEVNGYPGAIYRPQSHAKIVGELYKIKQHGPLFSHLDEYEQCSACYAEPHEYVRQCCPVFSTKKTVLAWVYLYNHSLQHLQKITDGNYLHFKKIK